MLSVLKRRFPAIKVSIFPTAVQGEQAAAQIVQAIEDANQHNQCGALIVGRGGGSLEDLWPFNEESVARAIFHSDIPIVSAVGHEIDFTIADFVADLRAPTPSAAAELLSPDYLDIQRQIVDRIKQLQQILLRQLKHFSAHRAHLEKRLQHPGRKLMEQTQNLDHLETRLNRAMRVTMDQQRTKFGVLAEKLTSRNSKPLVSEYYQRLVTGIQALQQAAGDKCYRERTKIDQTLHLLDAVSPLRVLNRGFSVIRNSKGQAIKSVTTVAVGEDLIAQLADGELQMTAKDIRKIDK
jgi:exodeoxyribonuclease VII large subunit